MKTLRRVFLAGKITGNDWRRQLVHGELSVPPGDRGCVFSNLTCLGDGGDGSRVFPVQSKAILSMLDYVGPYYAQPPDGTCGCDSGQHNHGTWDGLGKSILLYANQRAIASCDLVYAWLDDESAAATCYELGYATALGKELLIAGPAYLPALGLVYHADGRWCWHDPSDGPFDATPLEGFVRLLSARLAIGGVTIDPEALSPIEGRFLSAWNEETVRAWDRGEIGDTGAMALFPQYPIDGGRYRVDFAYVGRISLDEDETAPQIAIELDGFAGHSTTDQIARDRKRQRELEALGWQVLRFGGKEIHDDVDACVGEAQRFIQVQINRLTTERRARSQLAQVTNNARAHAALADALRTYKPGDSADEYLRTHGLL